MICSNCKETVDKLKGRGMCNTCYARWFRSEDKSGFIVKSVRDLTEYLDNGCKNGDVKDMLEEGMTFAQIGEHYGVGRTCVSRYVHEYKLYKCKKRITFAERTECVVAPDSIKYLALYSSWRLSA